MVGFDAHNVHFLNSKATNKMVVRTKTLFAMCQTLILIRNFRFYQLYQ